MHILEAVYERDIDLLILEELHCDKRFAMWFYQQTFDNDLHDEIRVSAFHSVYHESLGETDLLITYELPDRRKTAILVENKIDAAPQPQQAQRYLQRGESGLHKGEWDLFRTCIIAPSRYLKFRESTKGYHLSISYEIIRDKICELNPDSERSKYRSKFIGWAIEQQRRGYTPRIDEQVTRFYRDYWKYASKEFPELGMKHPGDKPNQSRFLHYTPPNLPKNRKLTHKLVKGCVDLGLAKTDPDKLELEGKFNHLLVDGLSIVQTGNTLSIRASVPEIDHTGDFNEQKSIVREALKSACRLLYVMQVIQAYNNDNTIIDT